MLLKHALIVAVSLSVILLLVPYGTKDAYAACGTATATAVAITSPSAGTVTSTSVSVSGTSSFSKTGSGSCTLATNNVHVTVHDNTVVVADQTADATPNNPGAWSTSSFTLTNGHSYTISADYSVLGSTGGTSTISASTVTITIHAPVTVTLVKHLSNPLSNSDAFNLLVDATIVKHNAKDGDSGSKSGVAYGSTPTVSETIGTGPSNVGDYDTTITCTNGQSQHTQSLQLNALTGDVTCDIYNTGIHTTLTVTKHLITSQNNDKFDLYIDNTNVANNVGDGGTSGAVDVTAGAHTVSEQGHGNTNLNNYQVTYSGDCDANGHITLNQGDQKSCTITNTEITTTLTVNKVLITTNNNDKFDLYIDNTKVANNVGDGGSSGAVTVTTGAHTVSEQGHGNTNLEDYTQTFSGDCDAEGDITLNQGDHKTCTITNTQIGAGSVLFDPICTKTIHRNTIITISTPNNGDTLVYTTDGSDPYTDPNHTAVTVNFGSQPAQVTITKNTVINAIAEHGVTHSAIQTNTCDVAVGHGGRPVPPSLLGTGLQHIPDPFSINGVPFTVKGTVIDPPTQDMILYTPQTIVVKTYTDYAYGGGVIHMGIYFGPHPADNIGKTVLGLIYDDSGNQLIDPQGLVSHFSVTKTVSGNIDTFTFTFTPVKQLPVSDMILRVWNVKLSSVDYHGYNIVDFTNEHLAPAPVQLPSNLVVYENLADLNKQLTSNGFIKPNILSHIHDTSSIFGNSQGKVYWLYDTENPSVTLVAQDGNGKIVYMHTEDLVKQQDVPTASTYASGQSLSRYNEHAVESAKAQEAIKALNMMMNLYGRDYVVQYGFLK